MTSATAAEIDVEKLRELYKADETAQALFDHLASRKRNRRVTTVDRLLSNLNNEGHSASRGSVTYVLKQLQEAECGTYIVGRHGHGSRFAWSIGLISVGMAAAGEDVDEFEDAPTDDMDNDDDIEEVSHQYVLRDDFNVELDLPRDLTEREAQRLADFVRTLPR